MFHLEKGYLKEMHRCFQIRECVSLYFVFIIINYKNPFKLAQVKWDSYKACKGTPREVQETEP